MPRDARRILCAEANSDVGDLLILLLEKRGYDVTAVQTIAECVRLATEEMFDLFIVNDKYEDGNSLDLCQQLRKLKPQTPLLLFSLDSSGYNRKAIRGTKIYVSKTSDFVALVQTIDQLFHSAGTTEGQS